MELRRGNTVSFEVVRIRNDKSATGFDSLTTEEPLEIRLFYSANTKVERKSVSVTMRTPGNDFELSAGFLFTEGVISKRRDIDRISYCTDPSERQQYNIVNVYLNPEFHFDPETITRNFFMNSSCGVCGKATLESLQVRAKSINWDQERVSGDVIKSLPSSLRKAQSIFETTGGIHASALFDFEGKLRLLKEDVGRHNAVDKIIGSQLLADRLPLTDWILAVSGRASFEIMQKAIVAGVPIVVAVGAPSSLAVELARQFNMVLLGFTRHDGFNIYSGRERIRSS